MTTSDKDTQAEPDEPRKKGGGDGDAKSATSPDQPVNDDRPAPEDISEPVTNRKTPLAHL